jgi:hypothetical protein
MIARLAGLLCLLALIAPGAALGQGAFDPIPPAPPEPPATQAVDADDEDGDGLSPTQQLLIGVSGLVMLFGIGWAIVRDARSAAPVVTRRRTSPGDEPVRKGSQKPASARHRESRAKAKAARQARKKARKR